MHPSAKITSASAHYCNGRAKPQGGALYVYAAPGASYKLKTKGAKEKVNPKLCTQSFLRGISKGGLFFL
jgi:hypothetical protein